MCTFGIKTKQKGDVIMNRCIRCGGCCNNIPMTKEQVVRILRFLQLNPNVIEELRSTPEVYGIPNVCVFLRGTIGQTYCTIYQARPEICKVFGVAGNEGLKCPNGTVTTQYSAIEAEKIINETYGISELCVGYYNDFFRKFINVVPSTYEEYMICFQYYIGILLQ